jgi:hypothetical protein
MPDYSLIPVDYQPDFSDYSLVPVDYDPFAADDVIQQARTEKESQPQRLAPRTGVPDVGAPTPAIDTPAGSRPVLLAAAGDNYPTADAVAIAALQEANPTSQRRGQEYAGRVYQKWLGLGDYSYTPPIEGDAFKSDPGNSVLKPLLHSLGINAGPYHTHTRGLAPELDENYSERDKNRSDAEACPLI